MTISMFGETFTVDEIENMSADRRRTLRQKSDIARGIHPLTRVELAGTDQTCGDCAHAYKHNRYWKCGQVEITFGPGTDLRKWWPACKVFEEKP